MFCQIRLCVCSGSLSSAHKSNSRFKVLSSEQLRTSVQILLPRCKHDMRSLIFYASYRFKVKLLVYKTYKLQNKSCRSISPSHKTSVGTVSSTTWIMMNVDWDSTSPSFSNNTNDWTTSQSKEPQMMNYLTWAGWNAALWGVWGRALICLSVTRRKTSSSSAEESTESGRPIEMCVVNVNGRDWSHCIRGTKKPVLQAAERSWSLWTTQEESERLEWA